MGIVARDFGMERARSSSSSSSSSGVLRWVVTLVLEDDTAEVEAMLVPKAAEALLGTPSTAPAAVNKAKAKLQKLARGTFVEACVKRDFPSSAAADATATLKNYITELRV